MQQLVRILNFCALYVVPKSNRNATNKNFLEFFTRRLGASDTSFGKETSLQ